VLAAKTNPSACAEIPPVPVAYCGIEHCSHRPHGEERAIGEYLAIATAGPFIRLDGVSSARQRCEQRNEREKRCRVDEVEELEAAG